MPEQVIDSFRRKVCSEIDLERTGINRFAVYTPFTFDDGDQYVILLRREGDDWVLTDEGHTLMHVSYSEVDLTQGTRAEVVERTLASHQIENRSGELRLRVPEEAFGDALFSFVQAIGRVCSTSLWTRDRVRSTFVEDFRDFLESTVPVPRLTFDYHDPAVDPDQIYPVDCRINGMAKPWFVFAVNTDARCRDATITCLTYERRNRPFRSVAMFEDQTAINRRAVAQLTDVIGKAFSSLGDRDRIAQFFRDEVLGGPL